jgi:hypothetical protein
MMRENVRQDMVMFTGGLITEYGLFNMPAGSLVACKNFEVVESGYRTALGYERFDGRTSPSSIAATAENYTAREAARALIQPLTGSGKVLGVIKFKSTVYAFRNAVDGLSAKLYKSTSSGWVEVSTGVTLAPNGKYQFAIYNFYAQDGQEMLYGVDGQNKAFQFNGTTFTQITAGATVDKPNTIAAHSMHLFLGFTGGSLMHSAAGEPLDFNVVNGAGEIGVGDEITTLTTMVGGVLQIGSSNRITMLSGSSLLDWQVQNVRTQDESAGCIARSAQKIVGKSYYLTSNGIREMSATNAFGDFSVTSISKPIEQFLNERLQYFVGSVVVNDKSQYRLYFSSGGTTEVVTLSFGASGLLGFSVQKLLIPVSCVQQSVDSHTNETIWLGSDNGYVYQAEIGTSYDGQIIDCSMRTAFMFQKMASVRKRYKKMTIAITSGYEVPIDCKPMFDYGSGDISAHEVKQFFGVADIGIWGVDRWGAFVWSAGGSGMIEFDIGGTAQSVSMYFQSRNAFADTFTLNSMIIDYIPRRLTR